MKVLVSGLVNIETTLKIKEFPIPYYPIDYPFFGIKSNVSGVAFNVAKAMRTLGNEVELISLTGKDSEGERIRRELEKEQIGHQYVLEELKETPASIVLFDGEGKRQIYCDLKDVQEKNVEWEDFEEAIEKSDMVAACNTNFNRGLLRKAKESGKIIATDVHVLGDLQDAYNREFMEYADILFLSDEQIPGEAERFLEELKNTYPCKVIVMGRGAKGALLYERESDKMYQFDVVKVENVVNTVGAGDALFSAFLNYYGKGHNAVESLKRAEMFAAIKIGYNGAAEGFCDEETVEDWYRERSISVQPRGSRPIIKKNEGIL